ncbi:hypothetical protein [Massilia sp. CCM 8734]|uniref:hypothetical protein n=1 Tax=Massilia sp. CCM 8734 TaxID=2609283 RepID=UPI0014233B82|nr:hypothetical protein [Massilia sp. CCM 8734]NHZ96527.1 hypothetical protein [Massilia sp. CCM 8734]
MNYPKTLAERLEWMAQSLPGFREELEVVRAIQQYANSSSGVIVRPLHQAYTRVVVQSAIQTTLEDKS